MDLNRFISAGLEMVPKRAQKLCIASFYRQFSTNIKIKNHKFNTICASLGLRPLKDNKTGFILIIFVLISMESCDK